MMDMKSLRDIVISALSEATTQPTERFDVSNKTPMNLLAIDSMALFSVLLSIEQKLENGDISALNPDTPAPNTFGELLQLAAKIGKLSDLLER